MTQLTKDRVPFSRTLLPLADVETLIAGRFVPVSGAEIVPLRAGLGRTLVEDNPLTIRRTH